MREIQTRWGAGSSLWSFQGASAMSSVESFWRRWLGGWGGWRRVRPPAAQVALSGFRGQIRLSCDSLVVPLKPRCEFPAASGYARCHSLMTDNSAHSFFQHSQIAHYQPTAHLMFPIHVLIILITHARDVLFFVWTTALQSVTLKSVYVFVTFYCTVQSRFRI